MVYAKQTWVDNTTPVDKSHMDHIEDGLVLADGNASTALIGKPSYGTTLPASPVDGQEAILVDSITNPNYTWRFRWNAGSSSTYKWEFVGGAPAAAVVQASEAASAAGYTDLATVGPSVVVSRAGDYDARCQATAWSGVTSGFAQVGICIGATNPATGLQGNYQSAVANSQGVVAAFGRIAGLAAGSEIRMRYNSLSNPGNWIWRWLYVTPVRVA